MDNCNCKDCKMHKGIGVDDITVGIYTDFSLIQEPEEEWAEIVEELEDIGLNIGKVVGSLAPQEVVEANPDLIILDYGGMAMAGARDTMMSNARYFCQWADDHPGRLVVIWTYFSAELYKQELEGQFGHLDNIIYRTGLFNEDVDNQLKAWFGVD